jgi:hypothetical protein
MARLQIVAGRGRQDVDSVQRAYDVHLEILEIYSKRLGRSHPVTADSCFKVGRILSIEEFPNANLRRAEAYLRKHLSLTL